MSHYECLTNAAACSHITRVTLTQASKTVRTVQEPPALVAVSACLGLGLRLCLGVTITTGLSLSLSLGYGLGIAVIVIIIICRGQATDSAGRCTAEIYDMFPAAAADTVCSPNGLSGRLF